MHLGDELNHWIRRAQRRRAEQIRNAPPPGDARLSDEARACLEATIAYLSGRDARNDDPEFDRRAVEAAREGGYRAEQVEQISRGGDEGAEQEQRDESPNE